MQANQRNPNCNRNDDVDPHLRQQKCSDSDHPEPHHDDPIVNGETGQSEGVVAGKVEEEPGNEDEQEDDHGDRMEDEAEEEDEQ